MTVSLRRILPLLLLLAPLAAAETSQPPIGARAQGMGGAFTAVADDATSIYWNPAGLAGITHQEILFNHASLFGSEIQDNVGIFLLPLSRSFSVAVDWYNSGIDDPELNFGENRFDLGVGKRFNRYLAVGVTGKLFLRSIQVDGIDVQDGSGFGFDVGALVTPLPKIRLGLLGQDVTGTSLSYDDGSSSEIYPANWRVAAAWQALPELRLAGDLDDRFHLGTEYLPIPQLAVRAGLQGDLGNDDDGLVLNLGAGAQVKGIRVDYAYESHPNLGSTHYLGIGAAFNFNASKVRIEAADIAPLYASLYKTYSADPFGSVIVTNLDDEPLVANVKVFVPGFMSEPSEQEVVLRPKVRQEVPLTAVFDESALALGGDQPVQVEISATYQSARLPRTESRAVRTVSYGPGAIDWSRGVEQAAAFVTPREPVVDAFARAAGRTAALRGDEGFGNRNLVFAAALFDALDEIRLAYVPDPQTPFDTVSERENAVDTIHYPRQTLANRTGDCDDTTVLYASLLGNVGIASRIVDAPGHVFLLFDTGVHERNALSLGIPEDLYVIEDQGVWIPVETTALGGGFTAAWELAAGEYRDWDSRGRLTTVDVARAQLRYEPGTLPPPNPDLLHWEFPGLETRLEGDATTVAMWKDAYQRERFGERLPVTSAGRLQLARTYLVAGAIDRARTELEAVLETEPYSAAAANDLGVVLAVSGDLGGAAERFSQAVEADASDPGIRLNRGLAAEAASPGSGLEEIATGIDLAGGYEIACGLLDLAPEPPQDWRGRTPAQVLADAVKKNADSANLPRAHLYWKQP